MHSDPACALCRGKSSFFAEAASRRYLKCAVCGSVFMERKSFLSPEGEKKRYQEHNNDPDEPGYRRFVSGIVDAIKKRFSPFHRGLDFGSGAESPIAAMLSEEKYNIVQYDPFFRNRPELLKDKYDYIACCEVIEHFRNPGHEFTLLRNILKKGGMLFCKTEIYSDEVNFDRWYYKNDPSHVFFYSPEALENISIMFGFDKAEIKDRLIMYLG